MRSSLRITPLAVFLGSSISVSQRPGLHVRSLAVRPSEGGVHLLAGSFLQVLRGKSVLPWRSGMLLRLPDLSQEQQSGVLEHPLRVWH